MSARDNIVVKAGPEGYAHIEKKAQIEAACALRMPLKDQYGTDQYYSPQTLLKEFAAESEQFERFGLKILPVDVVYVLFRCKLLYATKDEKEFQQRSGRPSIFGKREILPHWGDRSLKMGALEDKYLGGLEADIEERTLVTQLNSLNANHVGIDSHQAFFDDLFHALTAPLVSFLDEDLVDKHKQHEAGLRNYEKDEAKKFFSAPSLGQKTRGTENYCLWHGTVWLRTFLNMLRIAAFVHPGQRDFFLNAKMEPPTYPVFLGKHSQGSYQWHEDEKESWQKFPDGCLFRSWGFRGLSSMWLDRRNCPAIKQFMLDHKIIFECLKSPWSEKSTKEVAPTLDILSSATQIPDLGAKILLIYCCLEHLFVPSVAGAENSKYIVGGLNALKPGLQSWFKALYDQRCEYAHKGFVLRTDKTLELVTDSMKNVMLLLVAKLSVS